MLNLIDLNCDWKKLSSTLNAGAKIYGYRVDCAHKNVYKILGGLNRADLAGTWSSFLYDFS